MPQYNLQPHEIRVLKLLLDGAPHPATELERELGMDQVAVARAIYGLAQLGLLALKEEERLVPRMTREGEDALRHGLIEKRLVAETGAEGKLLSEIRLAEKNIALGFAKKKGYVQIEHGVVGARRKGIGVDKIVGVANIVRTIRATREGIRALSEKDPEELLLDKAARGIALKKDELNLLKSRRLLDYALKTIREARITPEGKKAASGLEFTEEVSELTGEMIVSGKWKAAELRRYNIVAPVKPVFGGRRHFVNQATEYMRRIYLEMGFREMECPLINPAFWNFDALFTAQDHPVREMQDTFYLDTLKGKLPDKKLVERVKKAHESGTPGSSGWQYKWNEEEAKRVVLRTHTTVLSARTLAQLKKENLPAKYFAIGKCFRNETLDWKHLFEFNQFEGIVVDENANFRHLLGYLKEFFRKLGFPQARFRPAYFPYTEMSIEIDVFHPARKQWIELGGAGIFRPEVVEPLLGRWVPVLAWGPGFDRILMDYYKIADIRDLYRNDVKQLREMKMWMW